MDLDLIIEAQHNKRYSGCLDVAEEALAGLSQEDLKSFIQSVFSEAEANGKPLKSVIENQKSELAKALENRLYRLNYQYDKLFDPQNGLATKIAKDPKFKLMDILSKNTKRFAGRNVETMQEAIKVRLRQQSLGKLSKNAFVTLMNGEHDLAIGEYLDSGKGLEGMPEIGEIGDMANSLNYDLKTELVDSTAMGLDALNKYRKFDVSYDPLKLQQRPKLRNILSLFRKGEKIDTIGDAQSKAEFIKDMKENSNLKVMFGDRAKDEAAVDEAFANQYDRIIRAGKINIHGDTTIIDKPQLEKQQKMFVVWKDWSSYIKHIKKYGTGSGTLYEQMMSDINSTGRQAGLARVLGADYNWGFKQLRKINSQAIANPAKGTYKNEGRFPNANNVYKNLTGAANVPYAPYAAQMVSNFLAYTGMVKQVALTPVSLNDTNFGLAALSEITKTNEFQNFATKMQATADVWKAQATKGEVDPKFQRMLENSAHAIKYELGAMARFIDGQSMGDITRKITHVFYKVNGMSGKDAGNRAGSMYLASKALLDEKGTKFEDLRPALQKRLASYDISPEEWDLVRRNVKDSGNEAEQLIGADSVFDLPKDQVAEVAKSQGKQVSHFENDLHAKIYSYLSTVADETILTPGAAENAMVNFGYPPGTIPGSMLRAFGQFKGFMYSYVNRILINGATDPTTSKLKWALSTFLYTLPMTMAGNAFYNASHGQDTEWDPFKWGMEDWVNNLTPGIGMFTKVLDPKQQNTNQMLMLLQSPSIKALWDVAGLGIAGVNAARPSTGSLKTRGKHVRSKAAQVAYDYTPINGVPYLNEWWRNNAISTKQ